MKEIPVVPLPRFKLTPTRHGPPFDFWPPFFFPPTVNEEFCFRRPFLAPLPPPFFLLFFPLLSFRLWLFSGGAPLLLISFSMLVSYPSGSSFFFLRVEVSPHLGQPTPVPRPRVLTWCTFSPFSGQLLRNERLLASGLPFSNSPSREWFLFFLFVSFSFFLLAS